MNKQKRFTGFLLIIAGVAFWLSWFLMPDPGTVDPKHILDIVRQSRVAVLSSVIIQIFSSVLYTIVLLSLTRLFHAQRNITFIGIVFFAIGSMGMCSDAFFHLLAYYMTDDSVAMQDNIIKVMHFMQTGGVIILVPLLLPFFVGGVMMTVGLQKQRVLTSTPVILLAFAFAIALLGALISNWLSYRGNLISLTALAMIALGHASIGIELIAPRRPEAVQVSTTN